MSGLGAWPLAILLAAGPFPSPDPPRPATRDGREEAIASLHRRIAGATRGTPEARRLAGDLAELGREDLAAGETGRAIELLGESYGLDEENGLILAELTLAYVRAQDFESAHFYLRLAEDRVTLAPPEIYAVLGNIYDGLHRLDDAIAAWGEFVRFGGEDPLVARRLVRARDELALARGQRSLSSDHFTIFADPAVPDELLHRASEDLEASRQAEESLLGARLPSPQVVVLHAGRAYFSLVSVPDWVDGVFDGKIRVSVEIDEAAPGVLSTVLAHELAHALIRSSSRDRAPGWLHEGVAQWCDGRRLARRELRQAVGPAPAGSLDALSAGFRGKLDRAAARALYAQALSFVEYLVALRGEGAVACIVSGLGRGAAAAEALRAETGLSPRELWTGWKTWAGL